MRKISKKKSKVKVVEQKEVQQKVISEESLLSLAMCHYASTVLRDAVERICGQIEGAQCWGEEDGFIRSGLSRVPIKRPRVRGPQGEIQIAEYRQMQSPVEYKESVRRALLGGLATRSFRQVGEALGSSKGLSKSKVSRIAKSFSGEFEKLMTTDCADIAAAHIDGIYYDKDLCLVAVLGINRFGSKRLLGLWAGSTENAELMNSVMEDLKDRNLDPKLFIIDGSKALKKAINKNYNEVPIQRCQVHKRRNILGHLGKKHEAWANLKMSAIFKAESVAVAMDLGRKFEKELEEINVTAANSWREAFPEVITILQIRDKDLRRSLATTNAIESMFSSIRSVTGRVKRWRKANQALYWTAAAYFKVQPNFRKIKGYRAMNELDRLKVIRKEEARKNAA